MVLIFFFPFNSTPANVKLITPFNVQLWATVPCRFFTQLSSMLQCFLRVDSLIFFPAVSINALYKWDLFWYKIDKLNSFKLFVDSSSGKKNHDVFFSVCMYLFLNWNFVFRSSQIHFAISVMTNLEIYCFSQTISAQIFDITAIYQKFDWPIICNNALNSIPKTHNIAWDNKVYLWIIIRNALWRCIIIFRYKYYHITSIDWKFGGLEIRWASH